MEHQRRFIFDPGRAPVVLDKLWEQVLRRAFLLRLCDPLFEAFADFTSRDFFDETVYVDRIVPDLQGAHGGIIGHPLPVGARGVCRRSRRVAVTQPEVTRRNDHTRGQTLKIPFPGSRKSLIKVVDVKDDLAFGRRKAAEVQLPSLFGVPGEGHNFFERVASFAGQLEQTQPIVLAVGVIAITLLAAGERLLPGKPVALGIVALSIVAASALGLPAHGVPTTGTIPAGLPSLAGPALRIRDVEGILPLAGGCLLLAYIESISAARTFAATHGYVVDPRQEFLGLGAANLATGLGQGYPVAGGLSQSAVNDKAGARTALALIFASVTLSLCLLFLTGLLENLPKAVLAAVVVTAISGLLDFRALFRMWRVSRLDFYAASMALGSVLVLGILEGILLAALASVIMLLIRASQPHVAFLGRIPGTKAYSDLARHPENEKLPGVIAFRPEASLIYVNADTVLESVLGQLRGVGLSEVRLVVCDLSASPYLDLAGCRMLHELYNELASHGIALRIVGAHGPVRDLLRADGLNEKVGGLHRGTTLDGVLATDGP